MASTTALIHTGLRWIGLSDESDRRALYVRITGRDHLTAMDEQQHDAVLAEIRRLGFETPNGRRTVRKSLSGRYAHKLQALWIAGWNLGVFRDRDDAALEAFVRRQTGLERERFLHHAGDAALVIEALKGWLAREAGVDWSDRKMMPAWQKQPGYRIAWAQWAILHRDDKAGFWPEVTALVGEAPGSRDLTDKQWIQVMNGFGRQVRDAGNNGRAV